ncbi:MAG TPA: RnfABCDGE type electron transport complex subunit B [Acidobacteriota bacterium]|jgi:RnfABCDGE-type electron transport complex B subunit|nr:RnfABCDGE type electron transport complex subunit B [Acidobacteriota bacterium]HRR26190.1 RnfABCDGE type electron transport complex subunit B [Acidobacteriota bacterium]HRV06962.1 RnfABCDGE type electron transport complex subunit B [Acidobacteriota bacterium]
MNPELLQAVQVAVLIMAGLGVFFASLLALADRYLHVEEDPRLEEVEKLLPGNNCGACGQPGCAAFAAELVKGTAKPGQCTVSTPENLARIAEFLGVDVGAGEKRVARLKCGGGEGMVTHLADYRGVKSCRAAVIVDGGGRACPWGCLGLGDCERSCTFDAISMNWEGLPQVSVELCTACEDCVEACPLDLFTIVPLSHKLFVQCSSPLTGEEARARCAAACDACGRCAADSPPGVIEIVDGLPVIHYDRDRKPSERATWRCPTGAIVWLEGDQFTQPLVEISRERIRA